ncbi:hypothetical protein DYB32_003445 [Aphanomyces invadans]|uniref:Uncharacterized protein n=1 Tax=Aphanomyces invadans TaxID=157072 RepID=A0A3R6ZSG8_9STRA|nr:hypothetical protein DYB32_003445 [Aphanomyces invadans]
MRRQESDDVVPLAPSSTTGDPLCNTTVEKKKPTRFIVTDAPDEPEALFSPRNVEPHGMQALVGVPGQPLQSVSQNGPQHVRIRQGKMEQKGRFTIIDLLPSSPRTEQFDNAQAHINYALSGRTDKLPVFDSATILPNTRRQAKISTESVTVSCDFSVQYSPQHTLAMEDNRLMGHPVIRPSAVGGAHEKWLNPVDASPVAQFPSRYAHFPPVEPTPVANGDGLKQRSPCEVATKDITVSGGLLDQLMHQASENQRLLEDMVLQNDSILREIENIRNSRPKALSHVPTGARNATDATDLNQVECEVERRDVSSVDRKKLSMDMQTPAVHSPKHSGFSDSNRSPRIAHFHKEIHISPQGPSISEGSSPEVPGACDSPRGQTSCVVSSEPTAANATIRISANQVNVFKHGTPDTTSASDSSQDDSSPEVPALRLVSSGSEELEDMMISQALHLMNSFSIKDSKTNHVSISSTIGNGFTQTTVFNPSLPPHVNDHGRPLFVAANNMHGGAWNSKHDHHAPTHLFPTEATFSFGQQVAGTTQGAASHPHQYVQFSQTQSITMQSHQPNFPGQVYTTTNEKTVDVFQCLDPLCQPSPLPVPPPFGTATLPPPMAHAGSSHCIQHPDMPLVSTPDDTSSFFYPPLATTIVAPPQDSMPQFL